VPPSAVAIRGQRNRKKRPQTTHHHDVSASVTITRKRHAFEGQALAVISSITRRGIHYLLTVLPDGSRSLIPASWTDWKIEPAGKMPPTDAADIVQDLGRLADFLRLRKLVDTLCTLRAESASCKESGHAIEPGLFRPARASSKSANSVGTNRRSCAHCGNRHPGAPHHTHSPGADEPVTEASHE
jgi:hypothetical protein